MFGLFKKKTQEPADFSGLRADMHNHLIPGIDDGSTDLESSIVMIRAMYELGYRKFVATPHVQWEMFKNTHEIIENGAKLVRERLAKTEMQVEFSGIFFYQAADGSEGKTFPTPDQRVPAHYCASGTLPVFWRP